MTRPRGTPWRGGRYGSGREAEHPKKSKAVNNGYDCIFLTPIRALIEDWEFVQVVEFVGMKNYDNQINFYLLVKNMLANLVEEV